MKIALDILRSFFLINWYSKWQLSSSQYIFIQFLSTRQHQALNSHRSEMRVGERTNPINIFFYHSLGGKIHCENWKYWKARLICLLRCSSLRWLRTHVVSWLGWVGGGYEWWCSRLNVWLALHFASLFFTIVVDVVVAPDTIQLNISTHRSRTTSQSETPNGNYEQTFSHHFSFNYPTPHRYK